MASAKTVPSRSAVPGVLHFGDFQFDEPLGQLRRGSELLHLQPKTMAVLQYLLHQSHRLIDKDELLAAVWPDVVVTEHSLSRCIKDLRKVLDDDAAQPRYIQTVSRRGYRFLMPPQHAPAEPAQPSPLPALRRRRLEPRHAALTALGLIVLLGASSWSFWRGSDDGRNDVGLAVLPFVDLSPQQDAQRLADGLAEDLLEHLSRYTSLRLVGRTSVAAHRGPDIDPKAVGKALGVRWLIDGSLRREGEQVRVVMHLTDTQTGYRAWSGRFDDKQSQMLVLQDRLARAAAERIQLRLSEPPSPPTGVHPAAYEALLSGRELFYRRTPGWSAQAEAAFRAALALEPGWPRAWAGLALVLAQRAHASPDSAALSDSAAKAAAEALRSDPHNAIALSARALVRLSRHEHRAAAQDLVLALQSDPSFAPAYHWHSIVLARLGDTAAARARLEAGLRMDPMNPGLLDSLGVTLANQGQSEAARLIFERLAALPSPPLGASIRLAQLHLGRGQMLPALGWALKVEKAAQPHFGTAASVLAAEVLARMGLADEAAPLLARQGKANLSGVGAISVEYTLRCLGRWQDLDGILPAADASQPAAAWQASMRARLHYLQGRPAKGDEAYSAARLDPEMPGGWTTLIDTLMARAWARQDSASLADATAWLKRLAPNPAALPAEVRQWRALGWAMSGAPERAHAELESLADSGALAPCLIEADPRWSRWREHPRVSAALVRAHSHLERQRQELASRRAAGEPGWQTIKH